MKRAIGPGHRTNANDESLNARTQNHPSGVNPEQLQVLIVDDERMMRDLLSMSLRRLGYNVTMADNGFKALETFEEKVFDLLILDVMMPGMDGFEVCSEVRKRSDVPIVMLTALSRPDDIVRGLELGADNYITKPFTFKEVEAKIQAIMRRFALAGERNEFAIMKHGDITINDDNSEVRIADRIVNLTRTEYQLLRYMLIHAGDLVRKEELLQAVWGYDEGGNTNLVELAVGRLRKKIEPDAASPIHLITIRGFGYKLVDPQNEEAATVPGNAARHRAPTKE